ncbi:FUSC family protein [Psychroflexus halocasei]|uniref:TIGR01666 family membrane protein n=1 Tax=Psychroflexus halocasei TaxID=908615 RepID=A0A1H4B3S8_9FLAO|nr:FUSC family membrane protein [Psychroflexus halocasei]SEA42845.1 TIGR01666 family membrane protein [Psychroflexus halocasei]
MNKSKRTKVELFLRSSHFFRAVVLTSSVLIPVLLFNLIGLMSFVPSFVIGTFLNAPSDIPGSLRRKVNGILISIGLTMLITVLILYAKNNFSIALILIGLISFSLSFLSAYGFRGALLAFSSLLAMVLAFALGEMTSVEIWTHILFMGLGGLWYLFSSISFHKIIPNKDENQLLSETLELTGDYLEVRARLLKASKDRESDIKKTFVLQSQINEKHETLRELLLTNRKRSGRSHFDEKRLLLFISLIDIFEMIVGNTWDYEKFDNLFGENNKHLEKFSELNLAMNDQLKELSKILITKSEIPNKENLETALVNAYDSISAYIEKYKLPQAREGALIMRNLYDYQKQILQEVNAIRYALADMTLSSKLNLKKEEAKQFLTLQEYTPQIVMQHFTYNSVIFRHALRLTIALCFAFVLGNLLEIQNSYWIMLTILVILRPNYGLTRERAKDRIIGTIIGGSIAFGIVLLTQNTIIYAILIVSSLILAFSLMQRNYRWAAAFITLNIVFVYSFIHPDSVSVIQYRVIDTIIGGVIAFAAVYLLFPSWEVLNLKSVLLKAIKKNSAYLEATQELYQDKENNQLKYKLARKEAFLALSELSAAFQRFTQDPKSKQTEFRLIYEIVTLNQTILSAIASLGSFVNNYETTEKSIETKAIFSKILNTLSQTVKSIDKSHEYEVQPHGDIKEAKQKLINTYQFLSDERDENIQAGFTKIEKEKLHQLQEAHLISNQLIWLVSLSHNLKKAIQSYQKQFIR